MSDALFDPPGVGHVPPAVSPGLSADQRRTVRQARTLAAGYHPIGLVLGVHVRLHDQAAPSDDRTAEGLRCGTCKFRELFGYHTRSYPKCTRSGTTETHGAATDIRAWWPACINFEAA